MAGSLSRRDIEMIFRAETDKATRPIADLGKAVKQARGELEGLVNSTEKTEASFEKLGDTTRELKAAQDELGTARSLLTQLNAQERALDKAQEKADAAAKKFADLKEQVAGAEAPSKRLVNSMEAAGRASAGAAEKLYQVRKEAAETREQIEGIIGPVANVNDAFRSIANTSQEIARGLAVAGAAADDYRTSIAAAAAQKLDDSKFADLAGKSTLLQEQINYIGQFENRVELLREAEQAQASAQREAASADVLAKARQKAALAELYAGNVALESEINAVAAAAAKVDQVNAFRKIAADANASLADVTRFGVAEDEVAAGAQRLGDSLSRILAPSAAVNRSLDSIEASITQASASIEGGRKSAAELAVAYNELQSAAAGINAVAGKVDGYRQQQAALDAATAKFEAARTEALALAAALDQPGENADEIAGKLRRAEAAVEAAGNAMQAEATKAAALSTALKKAGVDVNDLAQAEKRLTAAARETAAAQTEVTSKQGGKGGLFGLTPADATNLSYQINDIFTQLASGQSIFITLAQQGPQIFQIGGVQKYAAALKALLLPLGAVAAGVGVVVGAVVLLDQATKDSAGLNTAKGYVASLGEQGTLTAQQIGGTIDKLTELGVKAEDARAIVAGLNENGFDPTRLGAYTDAVKNAAEVTGTDMKSASDDLTAALTQGYDAVAKLNETYPVLTDAELAQIQAMYDSGKADEARQLIFDKFTSKYQDAADKMNGPWSGAWNNLKAAAASFGTYLSTTFSGYLQTTKQEINDLAVGVNYLLLRFRGVDAQAAGIAAVQNKGNIPQFRGNQKRGAPVTRPTSTAEGAKAADDAEREAKAKGKTAKAEDRIANARIKARREAQNKGYGSADEARLVAIAVGEEQEKIDAENKRKSDTAARKAKTARDKAAREAETLANKINSQEEQLQSALDAMGAKVAKVAAGSLQEQLTAATDAVNKEYDKLYRKLADFSKLTGGKGMIGNQTIAQYRDTLDANKEILSNQAKLKVYEDNVNDVLAQRKQLLADIEDKAQRGEISGSEAITQTEQVAAKFEPLIADITQAAVDFATKIGGTKPSAELQAFISKMQSVQGRSTGDAQADVTKAAQSNLGRQENALNQILSERNDLVEQYNTLNELGLITNDEARKRSAAAYTASAEAINKQIALTQATLETARAAAAGNPALLLQYDALAAKLEVIKGQVQGVNPEFARMKEGIQSIIAQNVVDGITRVTDAFGGAIAGTESWGDALKEAGLALLDFIAQTIKTVATLIIQALILKAVDQATGGFVSGLLAFFKFSNSITGADSTGMKHNGGTIGSYSGGQQRSTRYSISPAAVANAPRYHEGTPAVGLRSDEQVAVLQNGEKVMTERQQQLDAQAKARQGGNGRGLRQVLAFGDDQVAAAMAGPAGEDVTVTHLRRNVPLLKTLLQEG